MKCADRVTCRKIDIKSYGVVARKGTYRSKSLDNDKKASGDTMQMRMSQGLGILKVNNPWRRKMI